MSGPLARYDRDFRYLARAAGVKSGRAAANVQEGFDSIASNDKIIQSSDVFGRPWRRNEFAAEAGESSVAKRAS